MPSTYLEAPPLNRVARIPDHLINQIAAGEVVERPASVVKELLENCLDAGARRIDILLVDGGMKEISIIDDGSGIHPEDLLLCLERHATSKIRQAADLESIGTFGFRGEALASIASVAEVELRSRTRDAQSALQVTVRRGDRLGDPRPVGAKVGTALTVRHLFEDVPARKKFLRSVGTEFSHCSRVVHEIAAGNPQVAFYLHHQNRLVHSFVAPTRTSRIQEVFGWRWTPLLVQETNDDLMLEAYLSPGDLTSDRGELLLFINGRPVKNRGLLAAVRQAYASTLGPHHDPSGVLYLEIRKDWVDVNVHPQKTEVRCLRQETLYGWLCAAVRKAISLQPSARPISPGASAASESIPPTGVIESPKGARHLLAEPLADRVAAQVPSYQPSLLEEDTRTASPTHPPTVRRLKYLGQAKAAYLVCEDESGVFVVDQHALHEKLRFEELLVKHSSQSLITQQLLIPRILRIPSDLVPLLEENQESLSILGLGVEAYGDGDWAIKSLPEYIREEQAEHLVITTLRALRDPGEAAQSQAARAIRPFLATIACHSVVRAGQAMSRFEAESLLSSLDRIEQGWTCPHGRPVALRMDFQAIEKHFERK